MPQRRLADAEKKLQELGASRQTEREQQQYLVDIVSNFQALARDALHANYSTHAAFDKDEFRLITAIANLTDQYNTDFHKLGRMYSLEPETGPEVPDPVVNTTVSRPSTPRFATDDDVGDDDNGNESRAADFESFDIPKPSEYPDLENIIVTDWDIRPPREGIMDWIEAVHRRSRGLELGTLSANILASVFREQSAK
ncbi:dynamin family protein [Colletotrichum sp. SAR11_57]|nr:dynamin family protein [Colletotrichum sp. SAR11_57]